MTLPRPEHRVLHVIRSATTLVIIALGIGLAMATSVGLLAWAIASAMHHAANA